MIRNIPIIDNVIGLRIFILTIFSIFLILAVRTGFEPACYEDDPILRFLYFETTSPNCAT